MMEEHVYKYIEITGTSNNNLEDAIHNALDRTAKTVRKIRWFQVSEIRGGIVDDSSIQWQATIKLAFDVE